MIKRIVCLCLPLCLGCGGDDSASADAAPALDAPTFDAQPPAVDARTAQTVSISIERDGIPANATFAAYRVADGPWTALPGTAGEYSFELEDAAARYDLVVVCEVEAQGYWLSSSASELTRIPVACGALPANSVALSVSNAAGVAHALYRRGTRTSTTGNINTNFTVVGGDFDLFLTYDTGADSIPDRVIPRRGVANTAGQSVSFDLAAEGTDWGPTRSYTVDSSNPNFSTLDTSRIFLQSALGTRLTLGTGSGPTAAASTFTEMPSTERVASDHHFAELRTTGPSLDGQVNRVVSTRGFSGTGDLNDLPTPAPALSAPSATGSPLVVAMSVYDDGIAETTTQFYEMELGSAGLEWSLGWTQGALGAGPVYSENFPDLSGVAGWQASFEPDCTSGCNPEFRAYTSNKEPQTLFDILRGVVRPDATTIWSWVENFLS